MVKLIVIASLVLLATVCAIASWDSYIDNLIGHSNNSIDKACIIGLDGSRWTSNNHAQALKLTDNEVATISTVMKSEDYTTFQSRGIYIEGLKYQFLRAEDQEVFGKKKDHGGVVLKASKTGIIIAHVIESSPTGDASKATDTLAAYFESMGM